MKNSNYSLTFKRDHDNAKFIKINDGGNIMMKIGLLILHFSWKS